MGKVQSCAIQGSEIGSTIGGITGGISGGISGGAIGLGVGIGIGVGIACFAGVGVVGILTLGANGIGVGTFGTLGTGAIVNGVLGGTAIGTSTVVGGIGVGAGIVGGCGIAGAAGVASGTAFTLGGALTGVGAGIVGASGLIGATVGGTGGAIVGGKIGSRLGYLAGGVTGGVIGAVCGTLDGARDIIFALVEQTWHYFRKVGEAVYELVSSHFISKQQLTEQKVDEKLKLPEWKPTKMTQQQFDNILALTDEKFLNMVKKYDLLCSKSGQIMRQPCQMRCCLKSAQKVYLKKEIDSHQKCLLCQQPAQQSDIVFDQDKYTIILGIRQRVLKTYKGLDDTMKSVWKPIIDQHFGETYIEKHLQNWKPEKAEEDKDK